MKDFLIIKRAVRPRPLGRSSFTETDTELVDDVLEMTELVDFLKENMTEEKAKRIFHIVKNELNYMKLAKRI